MIQISLKNQDEYKTYHNIESISDNFDKIFKVF